jgi:glycosyltransferase involved in cell wall biosynthesis
MRMLFGVTAGVSLRWHEQLYPMLIARGCDIHVVATPSAELTALGTRDGITVHELPMERRPAPLRDLVALGRWIRLLRQIRPEVTMIATPKAALLGGIASWITRTPRRIYELFGLRLETASGPGRLVLKSLEHLTMRTATEMLAVSNSLRAEAYALGVVPRGMRIHVLGMGATDGVDVELFRPRPRPPVPEGLGPEGPVIGFVGRLARDKGLWEFADAMAILRERGIPVQALVVGSVDDPTGDVGLARLREYGIPVSLPGWVADTSPYYAAMDVFCSPSKREGLGGVAMEAMASGIPVVATDCTGQPDLIRDGDTGWLVPVGDAVAIADAVEAALADPAEAARRVANAYTFITEHFSTTRVRADLVRFLLDDPAGAVQ